MIRILRQLTPDELRQAGQQCGARPGTQPDEMIRWLARLCGAAALGIFPVQTDDQLLDHVCRQLGLPLVPPGHRAVLLRERAILAHFLRQAWDAAEAEERCRVLDLAAAAWDNPHVPRPAPVGESASPAALASTFEFVLQYGAGLRALAVASASQPLRLPPVARSGIRAGADERRLLGFHALFGVLLVLWRARARLLAERRARRAQVEQQIRQTEALLAARQRNLRGRPLGWAADPVSGLSVAAAAATSTCLNSLLLPVSVPHLVAGAAVGAAAAVWSLSALVFRPTPGSDRRVVQMTAQLQHLRHQHARVSQEILELEAE